MSSSRRPCLLALLAVLAAALAACGGPGAVAPTAEPTLFFEPSPTTPAAPSPFVEPTLPPFPTPAPAPTSYQGLELPAPAPARMDGRTIPLPAAWVVAGQRATPAAFGGYTFNMATGDGQAMAFHADSVQPELRGDVPQIELAPGEQPVLLIAGAAPPPQLQVLLREWQNSPAALYAGTTAVRTEALEAEGLTALRLHLDELQGSQLLLVSAGFAGGNSVDYFWRLDIRR